jgi:hypothetical protein
MQSTHFINSKNSFADPNMNMTVEFDDKFGFDQTLDKGK